MSSVGHALEGRFKAPGSPVLLGRLGDDRLVEQVRRGNHAAFEALYDRHHRGLLSFCRHLLGSQEEAEDALQQTFASAYRELIASDKQLSFKSWSYTVARNRCLSMLRMRRERPALAVEPATDGLSREVEQRAELRELLGDLGTLPADQRAALLLSELRGFTHADIGQILGCEGSKVKSLVFQARTSLARARAAREAPCQEIREELASLRGSALGDGTLRRHLRGCAGCARFRDEVRRQRRAMRAVIPVIPTPGLKQDVLAAVGTGGGGGAGGAAVATSLIGPSAVGKAVTAAVVSTAALLAAATLSGDAGAPPPGPDSSTPVREPAPGARAAPSRAAVEPALGGRPGRFERSSGERGSASGAAGSERRGGGQAGGDHVERLGAPAPGSRSSAAPGAGAGSPRYGGPSASSPTAPAPPAHSPAPPPGGSSGAGPATTRGFSPSPGGPNGDAAREFARDQGEGRKVGLPGPERPPGTP